MKISKPHFWYNKSQRNGVFFLLLLIVILQLIIFSIDFSNNTNVFDSNEPIALKAKIDSLKRIEIEKQKTKIYPFNPNYITDYKGAQLGMSVQEIDRLHAFRNKNKFINSVDQFQKVTQVSDGLLNKISPYFKFPDWVIKQQSKSVKKATLKEKVFKFSTTDINVATVNDFQAIQGVNEYLAQRIIKYRKRLQGFTYQNQLLEVWNLEKSLAQTILNTFQIFDKPIIKKMNVNTATFKQVLSNPYIDYELCKKIFMYRDEVAELQSIEELKNIEGFPIDKYDRIVLYLEAK